MKMDRTQAKKALADVITQDYEGDAESALWDLAAEFGVAVAFLDREWFEGWTEDRRGVGLTDAEWEAVKPRLKDYDERVLKSWVPDDFTRDVLRSAGVLPLPVPITEQ